MPSPLRFIDAHNHLQDDWILPHQASVIRELEVLGIAQAVVNGTMENDWNAVSELADAHPWVIPSYGLHPWFLANRTPGWFERLSSMVEAHLARGEPCAIGEIGLDRWMQDPDPAGQEAVFTRQLALAVEHDLPVTIHCLKAWGALWDLIRERPLPKRGFLLHAYGGPVEMVDGFVKHGAYFSFSGSFLDGRKTAKLIPFRGIPLNRLLVETDAPAMPLPPEKKCYTLPDTPTGDPVNHPANIVVAYEGLAGLRGIPVDDLARLVEENFHRLF